MSTSEIISLWKQKSEVDYIPLFISLWFSLNAWMKNRFEKESDRDNLELLKHSNHRLFNKFIGLIGDQDTNINSFRWNFGELQRSLENANIAYNNKWKDLDNWKGKIISFGSCPITWRGKHSELESVLKRERQWRKIKLGDNLWVENDTQRLFAAYMEIVYQIRCALFHGDIAPTPNHERVMKQLYLTLLMIMENI